MSGFFILKSDPRGSGLPGNRCGQQAGKITSPPVRAVARSGGDALFNTDYFV